MTDISALEAYAGQIAEAAVKSGAASEKQHEYIHGDDQSDVFTESGFVPTIAKQARLSAEGTAGLEGELANPVFGSRKVAWKDPVSATYLKVISDMMAGVPVSVLRNIPDTEHAAIANHTSTMDVAPYLNELFAEGYRFTGPSGSMYIDAELDTSADGFIFEGAGMGHGKDLERKQGLTRLWTNRNFTWIKVNGSTCPMIRDMLLQSTVSQSLPHIHFLNVGKGGLRHVRINGVDDAITGGGVKYEGGSMGEMAWCTLDNASVDVGTWDMKVVNCWLWANSKQYALRALGSIGNLTMLNCDVLPPRASVVGAKAGIYLSGAVLQPKLIGINGDGNSILDCGRFILAENGVIGFQMTGGNSSLLDSEGIVLDSIIAPQLTGHTFYNGNNTGARAGAADIVLQQTFAQPLEKPYISGNTHIQTVARAAPAPAVLVKAGTQRVGMRIVDGSYKQPGAGGGYTDVEILMEDGAFANKVAGSLRGNAGQRRFYSASGSATFAAGDLTKTVSFGVTLAYLPRVDQVRVNIEGTSTSYRVQVVNTSTILVGFPAGLAGGGTVHVSVELD